MSQTSFILYQSYKNQFSLLSMEQRGQLITAIFNYNETSEAGLELDPLCAMAFSFIKDTLDRDTRSYEERCEKNRENGKKGGRPKKDLFLPKTDFWR